MSLNGEGLVTDYSQQKARDRYLERLCLEDDNREPITVTEGEAKEMAASQGWPDLNLAFAWAAREEFRQAAVSDMTLNELRERINKPGRSWPEWADRAASFMDDYLFFRMSGLPPRHIVGFKRYYWGDPLFERFTPNGDEAIQPWMMPENWDWADTYGDVSVWHYGDTLALFMGSYSKNSGLDGFSAYQFYRLTKEEWQKLSDPNLGEADE